MPLWQSRQFVAVLTCLLLLLSFPLRGNDLLQSGKRVSIHHNGIGVIDALEQVRTQCGVSLMYQSSAINQSIKLKLDLRQVSLREALDAICGPAGLVYEENNDYILIKRNKQTTRLKKIIVKGIVSDEDNVPLPGATVRVSGLANGQVTDMDGRYEIEVETGAVLEFSFVGYRSQQHKVENPITLHIRLTEALQSLQDVVVTGYQTISKERATGAFDIVGQKNIDKPAVSVAERLVGVVPGVASTLDSEGNVSLSIRGQSTLLSSGRPLLVVDGFPIEGGFESINPNDVESISVLKDAAAASIWGARASNGVIVVTTKQSKKQKGLNVEFSAQTKIGARPDLAYMRNSASSAEMVEYEKSLFGKYGIQPLASQVSAASFNTTHYYTYTQAGILYNRYAAGELTEAEMNTGLEQLKQQNNLSQIQDLMMRRPVYQQYNLSLAGSTERMSNYVSLLYSRNDRRFQKVSDDNFQFNYRGKAKLLPMLDLYLSGMMAYQNSDLTGMESISGLAPYDLLVDASGKPTDLSHLHYYKPMIDRMVPKENFPYADWSYNPLTEINNRSLKAHKLDLRFQGGLTWKIIEGLTFDTKLQYERLQYNYRNLYNEQTYYVRNKVNTSSSWNRHTNEVSQALPSGSILEESTDVINSYNFRNQVSFARVLGGVHALNFVGGLEISQTQTDGTRNAPSYGYNDDRLTVGVFPKGTTGLRNWLGKEMTLDYLNRYTYHRARYFSAFANLSYTFDERYSLSASFRTDASNFITDDPQYRYSPFSSVGLSWNVSREDFMQALPEVDHLKLRFTYGSNGNANSSTSVVPLIRMLGYNQQTNEMEAEVWSKGNPKLRWERTNVLNLGVDFDLWKSRLFGKIDLYYKYSKDVLGEVAIPMINGGTSAIFNNAEIRNKGFELMLGSRLPIAKELTWEGNLSMAYNDNKIVKLFKTSAPYWQLSGEGSRSFQVEGKPLNSVYSYVYDGVKNVGTATAPHRMPTVRLKNGEYMPLGGQTTYDGLDFLAYQGTTVAPWYVGMTHTLTYQDFSLSCIVVGKFGHIFRRTGFNYAGRGETPNAQLTELLHNNADKVVPMPLQDTDPLSQWSRAAYLDYLTTSAANIRLQELSLSYNLPKRLLSQWGVDRLTLYCQGNNLLTWKRIDEDPEYLYGSYRLQPSCTFGLKLAF